MTKRETWRERYLADASSLHMQGKFEGVGLALRLSLRPGWRYRHSYNGQIRQVLTWRVQRKELSTGGLGS